MGVIQVRKYASIEHVEVGPQCFLLTIEGIGYQRAWVFDALNQHELKNKLIEMLDCYNDNE